METGALEADVVIVGLGPTGMVLANFLGQMGWSVVGLERDEDIYYAPRAVHFDDEIMRIFQAIGLSDEISRTSEPFTDMELLCKAGGKPRMRTKIGSQDRRYGHHGAWWFHQPTLERHLWEGMRRFANVKAFRGAEVTSVEQDADGVMAKAVLTGGERLSARARYLVGCDGGRSFVRKSACIELGSADFDEAWVVIDAKARCGGKDPALPRNHRQICDPRQPVTYVPMAGPYYEWQFMVTGGKSEREATNPALVRSQLKQFVDLDRIEINRIAYYKFHALWAKTWRNRRIILAGDAAHQMPPFLGQGMCSGVRDAHALAWRLDLILADRAAENLLSDYEQERSEHVMHIIKGAMFLGRVIETRNPLIAWLRNTFMFWPANNSARFNRFVYETANRKQPLKNGFFGRTRRKAAGRLAIQPAVVFNDSRAIGSMNPSKRTPTLNPSPNLTPLGGGGYGAGASVSPQGRQIRGGVRGGGQPSQKIAADYPANEREVLLDDLMGTGFAVVARQGALDPFRPTVNRLATERDVALVEVGPLGSAASAIDRDGKLLAWLDAFDADFVIVRPDRYIFDAGRAADFAKAMSPLAAVIRPAPVQERAAA